MITIKSFGYGHHDGVPPARVMVDLCELRVTVEHRDIAKPVLVR